MNRTLLSVGHRRETHLILFNKRLQSTKEQNGVQSQGGPV